MAVGSHNARRPSLATDGKDFSSVQADLFQRLDQPALASETAPDCDIGPELLGAINTALREARALGISRDRIVDRMNLALPDLERSITKRQLDCWTARSKEYHEFPMRYLWAFCWATQCDLPLRMLARAMGFGLVDAGEQAAKEIGDALVREAALRRHRRVLQGELERRL